MTSTIYSYNLTGGRVFPVAFEYLARRFVRVTLVGTSRLPLTLNVDYRFISKTEIETTLAWTSGEYQTLEIRRVTSATDRLVNFTDGSILRSQDLNIAQIQAIHIAEEGRDVAENSLLTDGFTWDALGRPIRNVGYPSLQGDAVNVQYVSDQLLRTLRGSPADRLNELPLDRQNKVLGFDSNRQPIALVPSAGSSMELELELAAPTGSNKVGWNDPVAPTFLKTLSDMLNGVPVSIMRGIPKEQHDDIYNYVSSFDVSPILNSMFLDGYKFTAPRGRFYLGSQTTTARDGFYLEGAGIGFDKTAGRLPSATTFWSDKNIVFFKTEGSLFPTIKEMRMRVVVPHSVPHVHFLNGARPRLDNVVISGINDSTPGSGVTIEGGSMGIINECVIDNAIVDIKTWDVHIQNSWVWANTKPYGIRAVGSIGNLLISGTDVLPPLFTVPGKKAGIYLSGAVTQPRIVACYGDGNPSLDTGPFILAENGVLGLQVQGGHSNRLSEGGIILDSIIAPQVKGHSFFGGNDRGTRPEAADIVLRQTFAQPLEKPLIQGNTHEQHVVRASPAPAILVKAGTQRYGMRIIDNTISSIGAGGGYTDVEIKMEDGAFTSAQAGSLAGNAGQRSQYKVSASKEFAIGETFITVRFPTGLAYLPRIDQIHVNFEGYATAYRVQVLSTNSVGIAFAAAVVAGTVHVSASL